MACFSIYFYGGIMILIWSNYSVSVALSLDEEMKYKFIQLKETLETEIQNQGKDQEKLIKMLETKVEQLEAKLSGLEYQVQQEISHFNSTQKKKTYSGKNRSELFEINGKLRKNTDVDLRQGTRMPASCLDLRANGHSSSGLYSIMGSRFIETVFCDFSKQSFESNFQKWIGYVDVKSQPVFFQVKRDSHLPTTNVSITFESVWMNIGLGMNLTTGIFTAPRAGIYFFSFIGNAAFPKSSILSELFIDLHLNHVGNLIAATHTEGINTNSSNDYDSAFGLQCTVLLNKNDKVWLQIRYMSPGVYLANHFNYFTGWLIEEDISKSLL